MTIEERIYRDCLDEYAQQGIDSTTKMAESDQYSLMCAAIQACPELWSELYPQQIQAIAKFGTSYDNPKQHMAAIERALFSSIKPVIDNDLRAARDRITAPPRYSSLREELVDHGAELH